MQTILSPAAGLAIAATVAWLIPASGGAAAMPEVSTPMPGTAASPVPAVTVHRVESVAILAGRAVAGAAGSSAPVIDTARQHRAALPIEPDDASYALIRWYLDRRLWPPPATIRITDLANAFADPLPPPQVGVLGLTAEIIRSPVRQGYHNLHLGLRVAATDHPAGGRHGTTFVVVVEGSTATLPALRQAVREFAGALQGRDLLGLVARGPRGRMVLEPTRLAARSVGPDQRSLVDRAVEALAGTGSPDLIAGLQAAYDMAADQVDGRPRRILLFTDGAGLRAPGEELYDDLRRQARAGQTLSVVGFPSPGYDHRLMARLARAGEGRYVVADNPTAVHRLCSRLPERLAVAARSVTGHIELDPATVSSFRFLGEPPPATTPAGAGRSLAAGSRVTALIELRLTGRPGPLGTVRVSYRSAADAGGLKQFELTLPPPGAGPRTHLGSPAWIAAAFGEKLGGSYWARDVSYGRLLRSFRWLDAETRTDPRTVELRYLIQQARRLEAGRVPPRRPDVEVWPTFDQLRILE